MSKYNYYKLDRAGEIARPVPMPARTSAPRFWVSGTYKGKKAQRCGDILRIKKKKAPRTDAGAAKTVPASVAAAVESPNLRAYAVLGPGRLDRVPPSLAGRYVGSGRVTYPVNLRVQRRNSNVVVVVQGHILPRAADNRAIFLTRLPLNLDGATAECVKACDI